MESVSRKPFQGVGNIIRFNWHFFLIALVAIVMLLFAAAQSTGLLQPILIAVASCTMLTILISLAVSFYVYDCSPLYTLNWLPGNSGEAGMHIVNVHAGFDESSILLAQRFPTARLTVFDFYDPALHTELSIQRARKVYPPYPGTASIRTTHVPLQMHSVDHIYLILAAHEIRNNAERIAFFQQLKQALRPGGSITVVEHLRNFNNLLAYNVGAFHFLSRGTWRQTFTQAGLQIEQEMALTPFIAIYILR
jgi:SAM-dependent methyltransferase